MTSARLLVSLTPLFGVLRLSRPPQHKRSGKRQYSRFLRLMYTRVYTTPLRSNFPPSFTATPFSVTMAVISSAGVTSKLGL